MKLIVERVRARRRSGAKSKRSGIKDDPLEGQDASVRAGAVVLVMWISVPGVKVSAVGTMCLGLSRAFYDLDLFVDETIQLTRSVQRVDT